MNVWKGNNVAKKGSRSKSLSSRKRTTVNDRLKKKARGTGFSTNQLRTVYNRGLAAYASSGSRVGMSSHQWAMARVNSFLRGGPARKVDMPVVKKTR